MPGNWSVNRGSYNVTLHLLTLMVRVGKSRVIPSAIACLTLMGSKIRWLGLCLSLVRKHSSMTGVVNERWMLAIVTTVHQYGQRISKFAKLLLNRIQIIMLGANQDLNHVMCHCHFEKLQMALSFIAYKRAVVKTAIDSSPPFLPDCRRSRCPHHD